MAISTRIRAVRNNQDIERHHLIGLGFWQAWQMVAMCTGAIIPYEFDTGTVSLRTLIMVVTTLGYLVAVLASKAIPSYIGQRTSLPITAAAMSFGTFIMLFVPYLTSPSLQTTALALALVGIGGGNAVLLIMWGEHWSTLATGRVGQHLYLSYAFAFVLFFVAYFLPHPANGLITCSFPIFSCLILHSCKDEPRRRPSSSPLETRPATIVGAVTFVFALSVIWGITQTIIPAVSPVENSGAFMATSMLVAGVAIGAFALNLAITAPESESIALYRPVIPSMAAGLVALAILQPSMAFIGNGLVIMGIYCLDMFIMLTATDLAFRTRKPIVLVFGAAILVARLGTMAGTFSADSLIRPTIAWNESLFMLTTACLGALVLAGMILFTQNDLQKLYEASRTSEKTKPRSTESNGEGSRSENAGGIVEQGTPTNDARDAGTTALSASLDNASRRKGPAETLAERCASVANYAGLTARETEVLELLLKGRTVQDVCQELTIAQGTAKHHVSNIYRKLGVGDRRSLYDIVDHFDGEGDRL